MEIWILFAYFHSHYREDILNLDENSVVALQNNLYKKKGDEL
jgi:hypothetical protein